MSKPRFWPDWFYRLYIIICYFGTCGVLSMSVLSADRNNASVFITELLISVLVLAGHEIIWRFFVIEHCIRQSRRQDTVFVDNLALFRQCSRQFTGTFYGWGLGYYLGTYFVTAFLVAKFNHPFVSIAIACLRFINWLMFACGLVVILVLLVIWGCLYLYHLYHRNELVLYEILEFDKFTDIAYYPIRNVQKIAYRRYARRS